MLKIKKRYINILSNIVKYTILNSTYPIDKKATILAHCFYNNYCTNYLIKNNLSLLGHDFLLLNNLNLFKFSFHGKKYLIHHIIYNLPIYLVERERNFFIKKNNINYCSITNKINYPYLKT